MKSITKHLDNVDTKYLNSAGNVTNWTTWIISIINYANNAIAPIRLFLSSCDKNIISTVAANINISVNGFDISKINIFTPSVFLCNSILS